MPRDPEHADRLRSDIDHGRAGDKVDFTDPAAAPLGTDDEAAGFPPTPEQVRHARAMEVSGRDDDATSGRTERNPAARQSGSVRWWITGALAVAVAVVLVLFLA